MGNPCRCSKRDAACCDGGGLPQTSSGCSCACHGGAEATEAPAPPQSQLAEVTLERNRLRWCLRRVRLFAQRYWSHDEECTIGGHADCGKTLQQLPNGTWGTAWRTCNCGLGTLLALLEAGGVPHDTEEELINQELDNEALRARADGRLDGLREARDLARAAMKRNLALAAEHENPEASEQRRAFAAEDNSLAQDLDALLRKVAHG